MALGNTSCYPVIHRLADETGIQSVPCAALEVQRSSRERSSRWKHDSR
jgi:hypothetical protein